PSTDIGNFDGVVQASGETFRTVTVPLLLNDGTVVGTLFLATSLDRRFADELKTLSRAETAIISDGLVLASTLPVETARQFETAIAQASPTERVVTLNGESIAFQRLVQIGDTSFYALASIDASSRAALREAARSLALIAIGAILLALIGSV